MTADSLTKDYGPLEHWRRITHSLGENPNILPIQDIIFKRYGGKKRLAIEENIIPTSNNIHPTSITSYMSLPTTTTTPPPLPTTTTFHTYNKKSFNAKQRSLTKYLNKHHN